MSSCRPFNRAADPGAPARADRRWPARSSAPAQLGLIAKSAAAGGADIIIVYNTGRTRLMGLATSHLLNHANPTTLAMYDEIANVVTDRPIIGGAEAQDPYYLHDLGRLFDDFRRTGFDGLINFPTTGPDPVRGARARQRRPRPGARLRDGRDRPRQGLLHRSVTATRRSRPSASPPPAATSSSRMPVGRRAASRGGQVGALDRGGLRARPAPDRARPAREPRRHLPPHGGPLAGAEDTPYLYEHTDAQGFLGASSVERIPVEAAILDTVRAFKSKQLRQQVVGA